MIHSQATYKTLVAAGINQLHASAISKSISEALQVEHAERQNFTKEIQNICTQLNAIANEMEKIELRMIIKLGSIVAMCSSLLFAALKLWA
jgi:hypothetical protein